MRVFLILIGLGFVLIGGQAAFTAITNTKQASYTIEDYVKERPKDKWLELTGCQLNVASGAYESSFGGKPKQVYIPVRPKEAGESDKVVVLLATKEQDVLDLTAEMQNATSEAAATSFIIQNMDRLVMEKDLKGLVRFGMEMDSSERRKLLDLGINLADDFVVIDDGASPEYIDIAALPAGLLLLWLAIFKMGRKQQVPPTGMVGAIPGGVPAQPGQAPPPMPGQPAPGQPGQAPPALPPEQKPPGPPPPPQG